MKDDILRKRISRFMVNTNPYQEGFYVKRRDNTMSERSMLNFSNNSILLFGIDFLSERKIQQYFAPFMVSVDKHDDSHCSVVFETTECLIASTHKLLKNSSQIPFQSYKKDFLTKQEYLGQWNQLLPYYHFDCQRNLWFRVLT